jgi:hypothetical protein
VTYITFAERLGFERGFKQGFEEGSKQALLRLLRALLKAKFGNEGEVLLAVLSRETPTPRLQELVVLVGVATTLDTVRPHFSPKAERKSALCRLHALPEPPLTPPEAAP